MQSEEVRVAGHETREVSLRPSVSRDHGREAEVRRVDVSIAVEINTEGRTAAARNLDCMCQRRSREVARYGGARSEGISRSGTGGERERRGHYGGAVRRALHSSSLALTGAGCAAPVDACPNPSHGTWSGLHSREEQEALRGSRSRRTP